MNAALAIQLMLGLLDRATAVAAVIGKAQAEGREPTDAEIEGLRVSANSAVQDLEKAIAAAKAPIK